MTRYGADTEPAVRGEVAAALVNGANCLVQLGRATDAIAAYGRMADRFAGDPDPGIRAAVALALTNKGALLGQLGHAEDATEDSRALRASRSRSRRGAPWRRRR